MCRNVRIAILLLVSVVLAAPNFGCGGGGLPRFTPVSQSPQAQGARSPNRCRRRFLATFTPQPAAR